MRGVLSAALLASLVLSGAAGAGEFRSGDRPVASKPVEDDLFIAGRTVAVDAPIAGGLFAAGASVAVVGPVAEEAFVAGGRVTLDGDIAGDLFAIGGSVALTGNVAGDAALAGASISVARNAAVAGDLAVTGGQVDIDGTVAGGVTVAGGSVTVRGTINGDLEVTAGELTLVPGAAIMGSIRLTGPDREEVPAGVTVGGTVVTETAPKPERGIADEVAPTLWGTIGSAVGLFVMGAVLYLIFPRFVSGAALSVGAAPGRAFLTGLGTLVLAPLLMVLLCITIIGIPLALVALFAYMAVMALGVAVAGFGLAELVRRDRGRPSAPRDTLKRYAFVALLLTMVGIVPVLGDVALFVALAVGVGAFVMQARSGRALAAGALPPFRNA
ncbi:MAG TPA: hypothetical protein VED40_22280 [Azospirillaceae bacterium]|nr:hypothetical protein [Azospirillaceae bacterium]